MKVERRKNFIFSVLALFALWLLWLVLYFAVGNGYVLPSFWETFAEAGRLLISATFWRAFAGTFLRSFLAFLVSAVLGLLLALLAAEYTWVRAFLAPVVSVLRTAPTVAVILILLLWSSPAVTPVIVAALVLFPAAYSAALSGFDEIKAGYGDLVRTYRVEKKRTVFLLYLPLSAPNLLTQAGAIFSLGLKITVSGEVLASTYKSLGGMMQEAKMFVEMPRLLALTLLAVLLGFAFEGLFALVRKFAVRWKA